MLLPPILELITDKYFLIFLQSLSLLAEFIFIVVLFSLSIRRKALLKYTVPLMVLLFGSMICDTTWIILFLNQLHYSNFPLKPLARIATGFTVLQIISVDFLIMHLIRKKSYQKLNYDLINIMIPH